MLWYFIFIAAGLLVFWLGNAHVKWWWIRRVPLSEAASRPIINHEHALAPITVFYAGNGNTVRQAARYTGGVPVAGYYNKRSAPILYGVISEPSWSEPWDADRDHSTIPWYYRIFSSIQVRLSLWYTGTESIAATPPPLAYINPSRTNLAQEGDTMRHRSMLVNVLTRPIYNRVPIVLFGCSRGAATTLLSVLLLHRDDPTLLVRVKAVILEAPFSSVDDVIDYRFAPILGRFVRYLLERFTQYRSEVNGGTSPVAMVNQLLWPAHIPLLVVTSKADTVVSPRSTKMLVDSLKSKCPSLQLAECVLESSPHSTMSMDNDADALTYRNAVETFLKKALTDSPVMMWT